MKIKYQSLNTLPEAMQVELRNAVTADVAQKVFNDWANKGGYVEPRSRGAVWMAA